MGCLLEQLAKLEHLGQVQGENGQQRLAELLEQAQALRAAYPGLNGQALALEYTSLDAFILALMAFDGCCRSIYLCPGDGSLEMEPAVIKWPAEANSKALTSSATNEKHITQWYLSTSGTTGQPKWFEHTFSSLTSSIRSGEKMQALCWGLMYQPFRFAGLQVLLQAMLSGANVVYAAGSDALQQIKLLSRHGVNAVSATPSMWRQLIMTSELSRLGLKNITLGGEIADQTLLDGLKEYLPDAKIRHIYASTEAGVGFVVADGKAGFPAKWLESRIAKVALKVDENQHLRIKPQGQISAALQDRLDPQGYIDTLDRVQHNGDRVYFLGRVSGIINVGGNKVHPEHVEQILLQVNGVKQARVYGKTSHIIGQLVAADVVIGSSIEPNMVRKSIFEACKIQLQRYEIPSKINFIDAITYNANGKMNREAKRV